MPKKKWFVEQGKDMKKQESIISRNERGRHAFLLVYDVCDKQSWDEVKRLVQLIQKRMYKTPVPIMIVGTKTGQCALPLLQALESLMMHTHSLPLYTSASPSAVVWFRGSRFARLRPRLWFCAHGVATTAPAPISLAP